MKSKLFPAIILGVICLSVTLMLASVNALTEDVIAEAQYQKEQQDLQKIMPNGKNFVPITATDIPKSITNVYIEDGGGYVFRISTKGYNTGLVILCGIDANGNLTGVNSTITNETPSKESGIGDLFDGMTIENQKEIIVSGATKTSKAYSDAVRDAFEAFEKLTAKEELQ